MIKTFKHKGLKNFYLTGNCSGINANHAAKLFRILDRLDAAMTPEDMNLPGYKLHELIGQEKNTWSVWVSGNWRVTFKFEKNDAINVNYLDYH
ncbi:MAG TPA: peptidase [Gammaproteobacteria bacterium]|nr:peptidase [Gammaproteobacteria bacterium]